MNLKGRNFLTLKDFTPEEILYMIDLDDAQKAKKKAGELTEYYKGKNIALIFEKTSTRTRCAFEVAAHDLGMGSTYLDPTGSQIGKKESIADTARVLGRMYDGIEYRGFGQEIVEDLAKYAGVPVWNGLTNEFHPTQMLADMLTIREHFGTLKVKVVYFSSKRKLDRGLYLDGEDIFYADGQTDVKVINVNELNILGKHNYENVMAAVGMSLSFGVPMEKIVEVLKKFVAVEHRIEYVTEKRGVKFYNDSKGTNPDAAIKGIQAMNRPTLLIGGGYDKQSEYDEWIESFDGKVKKLVLIGVTKEKIADCAKRHGFTDYVFADSLEEAVNICYDNAVSGDAVLLSPACASWDMFKSYEERGRIFKDLVRNLKE